MTQELEATPPSSADRDKLMTTELVPEQILPKVMSTFGLTPLTCSSSAGSPARR